jgi:hypothetical protein
VWLEGLGKLKKNSMTPIGSRTDDLPTCRIMPQLNYATEGAFIPIVIRRDSLHEVIDSNGGRKLNFVTSANLINKCAMLLPLKTLLLNEKYTQGHIKISRQAKCR